MTDDSESDGVDRQVNQAEQNVQNRLRSLHRPARRPETAPPSYAQATLPPYPDDRVYRVRMGDADMAPVAMTPEQAANHFESMGFQVYRTEFERQQVTRPPEYETVDENDGALFAVRPVTEYRRGGALFRLDYRRNTIGPERETTLGLAIHQRGDPVILSEEDRARLSETAVTLEHRQTARELDWLNENIVPRYTSALERLEQIYRESPPILEERSQALWDRLDEFTDGFRQSLSASQGGGPGEAAEGHRAAEQRPPARHRELPLSEEARRNVMTDLDEMLAEQFPEAYEPARARSQTPSVSPRAEAEQMDFEFRVGSQESAPVRAASSQEEVEQFAQPRDDFPPISPDRVSWLSPSPELGTPEEAGRGDDAPHRFTPAAAPASGERPPFRSIPEPAALTVEQQTFLADWPHDRQPTFEEMDELMVDARAPSPARSSPPPEPAGPPDSGRVRSRKRARGDVSDIELSGSESPGEGPSNRPPSRRRRLMPSTRAEETQSEPAHEDNQQGNRQARQQAGSELTDPGNDEMRESAAAASRPDADTSPRPPDQTRSFDEAARALARQNRSR